MTSSSSVSGGSVGFCAVRALPFVILLATVVPAAFVGAQTAAADPEVAFDFSDFIAYTATYDVAASGGTQRETYSYRVLRRDGADVFERRLESEWLLATAIPRATWRQTLVSLATLPDLEPIATRQVTHQWTDSTASWSTATIEAHFDGASVHRVETTSAGETRERTRPLPAGVRQSEMGAPMFAHYAGPRRPSGVRIPTYNAVSDTTGATDWEVVGEDTITVLGIPQRAWAVTLDGDTSRVAYYRVDQPRLFLGSHVIREGTPVVQYRLIRLWCEGASPGLSCVSPEMVAVERGRTNDPRSEPVQHRRNP